MPFLVYAAVIIATVFGVVLEWDALIQRPPSSRHAVHVTSAPSPPPPSPRSNYNDDVQVVRPATPATPAPGNRPPVAQAPTGTPTGNPNQAAGNPAATSNPATAATAAGELPAAKPDEPQAAEQTAPPQCDVNACAAAYGSFRASDCTWQPFDGPRRLCSKGAVAEAAPDAANARADGNVRADPLCHYRTCAEHYSSFNPSDCTYQPLDGPRRRCQK